MSVSRKDFLKVVATGGLGVLFGGAASVPKFFEEKGARLTTVRRKSLLMGSVAEFEVVADSEAAGYEAIRKGVKVFRSIDRVFSMYKADSEMGSLSNAAGKDPIRLSEDAITLLNYAKELNRTTNGLFDITIEPVMRSWGFRNASAGNIAKPTRQELKELERLIGSEKILLEDGYGYLTEKGMAVDMGGIAGGYALDKAILEMKKCDISSAFINFSGDIHCFGKPFADDNWKVHILNPKTKQPLEEAVELRDEALSTSGAYQNRRGNGHSSWGHLVNPAIVKPVDPIGSVTAIHSSALVADAWSTASFVGAKPPEDMRTIVIN